MYLSIDNNVIALHILVLIKRNKYIQFDIF